MPINSARGRSHHSLSRERPQCPPRAPAQPLVGEGGGEGPSTPAPTKSYNPLQLLRSLRVLRVSARPSFPPPLCQVCQISKRTQSLGHPVMRPNATECDVFHKTRFFTPPSSHPTLAGTV